MGLDRNIVDIKSEEDYMELTKKLKTEKKEDKKIILAGKLVFNDIGENFFRVSSKVNHTSGYYVSETLKNKIQEDCFTGMDFKSLEELNPKIEIEIV